MFKKISFSKYLAQTEQLEPRGNACTIVFLDPTSAFDKLIFNTLHKIYFRQIHMKYSWLVLKYSLLVLNHQDFSFKSWRAPKHQTVNMICQPMSIVSMFVLSSCTVLDNILLLTPTRLKSRERLFNMPVC